MRTEQRDLGTSPCRRPKRGAALLTVLWLTAALTAIAFSVANTVRGEIERMEGRMRVLKDLTSLTTINLGVDEIKDYVPEGDPTYGTRVRRAFTGSISALVVAAKAVSIAIVAAVPWLGVLLVVLVMVFMLRPLVRKLFRRAR